MIINAEPMAIGAKLPMSGLMTHMPTVRTRKKVPTSSVRYFFMSSGFVCRERTKSALCCERKVAAPAARRNLRAPKGSRRQFPGRGGPNHFC